MHRWLLTGVFTLLSACSSSATDDSTDDAASSDDSATGDSATPAGCKSEADCLAGVTFSPEGCATAKCDIDTGACTYAAKDLDGDEIPGKTCSSPSVTVEPGTDCDDGDPKTHPGAAELCDGRDNDCDGTVDEDLPMSTEECTVGVGECARTGKKTCVDGSWKGCDAVAGAPGTEICDGKDNDCDGTVDSADCDCVDGSEQECGKSGFSPCKLGKQQCVAGKWAPCVGNVDPKALDSCVEGNDDSCDGIANNGMVPNMTCACLDGKKAKCKDALGAKGSCATGDTTCVGGKWGACTIKPAASDTCDEGNDADCDGKPTAYSPLHLPSSCECVNGHATACYTRGKLGTCGLQSPICSGGKTNCPSYIGPDTCDDGNDDSCNGVKNEACPCINNWNYPCSGGSICSGGIKRCNNGKAGTYDDCVGTSGTVYVQTYRYDGDGDGGCWTSKTYTTYPYFTLDRHSLTQCSSPGPKWKTGSCGDDCYDGNGFINDCGNHLAQTTDVDWGKPWRWYTDCEDHTETIYCVAGYHFNAAFSSVTPVSGGGSWSAYCTDSLDSGSCTAHICSSGTESKTLHWSLRCDPY